MKIHPKIMTGFTFVAGVIIVIELVAISHNNTIMRDFERHITGREKWIGSATQLILQIQKVNANINELLYESMRAEEETKEERKGLIENIKSEQEVTSMILKKWKVNSTREMQIEEGEEKEQEQEELEAVLALEKKNDLFGNLNAELFHLLDQGESMAAYDLWREKAQPLYLELQADSFRLFDKTDEEGIQEGANLLLSLKKVRIINILAIPTSLLLALIISLFISRKIVSPIIKFKQTMEEIIDLNEEKLVDVDSKDEVADLAQAFNQLIGHLHISQAQLIQSGKLAAIGELTAGIAHELNQPLMVLRSKNQLLQRRLRKETLTPEQIGEAMESVDRNTKRMMNIIDHLRAFSRQSGQALEMVQINQVIDDCFLLIGEQLRLRDIQIRKEFDLDLPKIKADNNRLEQVFLNLLGNARDAVVEKRKNCADQAGYQAEIAIHTAMSEDKANIVILISDNGGGIPPGKEEIIFDPFVTTKEVGQGTGLGLSISYGIIQEHGGRIRVAKSGPEGTTFIMELPVGVTTEN